MKLKLRVHAENRKVKNEKERTCEKEETGGCSGSDAIAVMFERLVQEKVAI